MELVDQKTCAVCTGLRKWQLFYFIGWPREIGDIYFKACSDDWTHSVPTDMFER